MPYQLTPFGRTCVQFCNVSAVHRKHADISNTLRKRWASEATIGGAIKRSAWAKKHELYGKGDPTTLRHSACAKVEYRDFKGLDFFLKHLIKAMRKPLHNWKRYSNHYLKRLRKTRQLPDQSADVVVAHRKPDRVSFNRHRIVDHVNKRLNTQFASPNAGRFTHATRGTALAGNTKEELAEWMRFHGEYRRFVSELSIDAAFSDLTIEEQDERLNKPYQVFVAQYQAQIQTELLRMLTAKSKLNSLRHMHGSRDPVGQGPLVDIDPVTLTPRNNKVLQAISNEDFHNPEFDAPLWKDGHTACRIVLEERVSEAQQKAFEAVTKDGLKAIPELKPSTEVEGWLSSRPPDTVPGFADYTVQSTRESYKAWETLLSLIPRIEKVADAEIAHARFITFDDIHYGYRTSDLYKFLYTALGQMIGVHIAAHTDSPYIGRHYGASGMRCHSERSVVSDSLSGLQRALEASEEFLKRLSWFEEMTMLVHTSRESASRKQPRMTVSFSQTKKKTPLFAINLTSITAEDAIKFGRYLRAPYVDQSGGSTKPGSRFCYYLKWLRAVDNDPKALADLIKICPSPSDPTRLRPDLQAALSNYSLQALSESDIEYMKQELEAYKHLRDEPLRLDLVD